MNTVLNFLALTTVLFCCSFNGIAQNSVTIVTPQSSHVRIKYGAERLAMTLAKEGYGVKTLMQDELPKSGNTIFIGKSDDKVVIKASVKFKIAINKNTEKEGFSIQSNGSTIMITGADLSGVLYGCIELAEKIQKQGQLPANISETDHPEMVLRGACVGLQKPYYLPGRTVYEYPYTPEVFPWLYDKERWIKYLDMMAQNRLNSLYLWNGHPFASLVRLEDYPYAVEVDDDAFKKNEEIFKFLTEEADRRGIWVIQMFYNIIVSKTFAEKNNLKTQDRNRPIIPIIADYTQKSIAAFVAKYPNVGLLITLGEAMEGKGQDDVDWFIKTIIPGVKDGLKQLGKTDEPPIVLRAHDTDAPRVMKAALPFYKNLYTMAKYNGEALTTYTPRGPWAELHRSLSRIGTVHIQNVHILANLEPFRYGSPDFIQKCVQAMHNVYEANGLHLYPQASYWDWPYSADKVSPRLEQLDRDWIWYAAWARYAWNCHRDRKQEINFWSKQLGDKYDCSLQNGQNILEAYEEAGEIEPKLLRRFGITDGNRQTLSLGMFMKQLINPRNFRLYEMLYNSEGPEGEMLIEYAEKEWRNQPHRGETPTQVAEEVQLHGRKAVGAIERATSDVTANRDEFKRIKNDIYCQKALADFYAEKARAALLVLRYKYSDKISDLVNALTHLEKSVSHFKALAELTKDAYLYANSMQTAQRTIPIPAVNGKFITWMEMLPLYEQELDNFKKNLASLQSAANDNEQQEPKEPLKNAVVALTDDYETIIVDKGQNVFTDTITTITDVAVELVGLKGIRLSKATQQAHGTTISFENSKPVKVLVGFFSRSSKEFSPEPQLEHDASANSHGQSEVKIANAMAIPGFPPVNVHAYDFKAGNNTLTLEKGASVILGFIEDKEVIDPYNAGLGVNGEDREIEWLFD